MKVIRTQRPQRFSAKRPLARAGRPTDRLGTFRWSDSFFLVRLLAKFFSWEKGRQNVWMGFRDLKKFDAENRFRLVHTAGVTSDLQDPD